MRRHFRYMVAELVGPLLIVVLSLTGVVWLTQSLRFIDLIINKGLSLGLFLKLTVLLLPWLLGIVLPVALFIAVVYTYHRLMTDSEIVVLRAAGLSNFQLSMPGLVLSAVVAIAVLAVNLYFMPAGFRAFKDLQHEIRNSLGAVMLQEGTFNTPIKGLTIYVRERAASGELAGVLLHDSRDPKAVATIMAAHGMIVQSPNGLRFILENGIRQQIGGENDQLSTLYFDRFAFEFADENEFAPRRFQVAEERYLGELLWPSDHASDWQIRKYRAEAHRRLASPLFALVLTLLAVAALLPGELNRRGHAKRITIAIIGAVTFQAAAFAMQSAMVGQPWTVYVYYTCTISVGLVAAYFLINEPSWRLRPPPARSHTR